MVPGVSGYGILAVECTVGTETVEELLSVISVDPPAHLALPEGNPMYLLRQGTTTSLAAAAMHHEGCMTSFQHGAVDLEYTMNAVLRTTTVTDEHSAGPIAARVDTPEPVFLPLAGGLVRVFDVATDTIGVLDIRVSGFVQTLPVSPASVTENVMSEAAFGYHVVPREGAPHNWEILGARCESM